MVENSYLEELEREDRWPHNWESDVVYLNNAGEATLSPKAREAGIAALNRPPWDIAVESDRQRIRELFASFIEADPTDIAIVPSTAFAITMAAKNIQTCLSNRDGRIIVIDDQMCSAIYPWQQICSESNYSIQLEIVSYPTNETNWTDSILQRMGDDILVVCLPPLHWSDGSLIDLEAIGSACKKHGSIFVVDATQAVGIMPCSVKKFQPSLLACSVHKWLRGPPGMSLVYVSPKLHKKWSPLDQHGRSRDFSAGKAWEASRNEMSPRGYEEKFLLDARKFDSGGKANPLLLPMLRAAMEEVALLDLEEAQKQLKELIAPLLEWAENNSYIVSPAPHASHLIGVRPLNRTTKELLEMCDRLKKHGIYVAVRCGLFRISPYLSNTESDIKRLIQGLENVCNQRRRKN